MQDAKRNNKRPRFTISGNAIHREQQSPFRYCGGKHYALKHLLPFINCVPHDEFREPFVGGGSVFFAKQKAAHNWINDLEPDLIKTYRVIANPRQRQKLRKRLASEVATRERHAEIKDMRATRILDIAFKTYYLTRTSYSGIIHVPAWGYRGATSANGATPVQIMGYQKPFC